MCSQKYAKYATKYAERAKYVILKKICRICTPHFADDSGAPALKFTVTPEGPPGPARVRRRRRVTVTAGHGPTGHWASFRPGPGLIRVTGLRRPARLVVRTARRILRLRLPAGRLRVRAEGRPGAAAGAPVTPVTAAARPSSTSKAARALGVRVDSRPQWTRIDSESGTGHLESRPPDQNTVYRGIHFDIPGCTILGVLVPCYGTGRT